MEFSNLQELGIVITEWSGLELDNYYFVRSACPGQKYPNLLEIAWRNQPQWVATGNLKKPVVDYGKSRIPDKPYMLHLISFSPSMKMNFLLDDVLFPFKLGGLIMLVRFIYWQELLGLEAAQNYAEFQRRQRLLGIKAGIGWAKSSGLPIVVAPVQDKNHPISTNKIHWILALKPQVPVLPYYVDYDNEREGYELGFTYEYTQLVLSALVNQIEMGGL